VGGGVTKYFISNGEGLAVFRCYATNRKVVGSIPDGVTGIFL